MFYHNHSVASTIISTLANLGYYGLMKIAANSKQVLLSIQELLKLPLSGISYSHIDSEEKQASDTEIVSKMDAWRDNNPPPATAMLISGDGLPSDSSQAATFGLQRACDIY